MFYETYIEFYSLFDDDSDNEKNIEMRLNEIKHNYEYNDFQPWVLDVYADLLSDNRC